VTPPAAAAPAAEDIEYAALAARLVATGIIPDPWIEGRPRFRLQPVMLPRETAAALARAAEDLAAVFQELALLCAAEPALVTDVLGLTPFQRLMWDAAAPLWHGIARADVFLTGEGAGEASGPVICEINSDTPSGEAEAVLLSQLLAERHPEALDPNRSFGARFCDMLALFGESVGASVAGATGAGGRGGEPFTVGILYPTELTEDLSMVQLYRRWCEARGWRVVLGSPYNLGRARGRGVALFGVRCHVLVRHYKTDWWGERLPVWKDEAPLADAEPLHEPLGILLEGVALGQVAIVNPLGTVVTQNKRAMALLWEAQARLSPWAQEVIRRHLPLTVRLERMDREALARKDEWVLKSDYGCEGSEVVIGAEVSEEEWQEALAQVIPSRWVAQRYFRARRDAAGAVVNHGVYLVAGQAAGFLSRVQVGATDYRALTAPTFVERGASGTARTGGGDVRHEG
jgi:hypothetical protein